MSHGGFGHHSGHMGHGHMGHGHMGHGHMGHGHGVSIGSILGLGGHHSFLGHLLGLHGHGHHCHGMHGGHRPQDSPSWNGALQGEKLSNRVLGINASPALLLGSLFLVMVLWLGLISWLRHHDSKASQIFWDASQGPPQAVTKSAAPAIAPVTPPSNTLPSQSPVPPEFGAASPTFATHDPTGLGSGRPQLRTMYTVSVPYAYGTRVRVTVNR